MSCLSNSNLIFRLRDGLKCVLRMSRYGNQYLQLKQPWAKYKGSDDDR
jgi:methionyl-tRNA synthetase